MKVIGLTGGTGSGKSAVTAVLKENGAFCVDADAIAHEVILRGHPAYDALVKAFGQEILGEDGEIVRKKLGQMVFTQGQNRIPELNRCTHPAILAEIRSQLEKARQEGWSYAVLDAPLLLEGPFQDLCDEIWVVYAPKEVRLARIMARDDIGRDHAEGRMAAQRDWDAFVQKAPIVIENGSTLEHVRQQVIKQLNKTNG